MTFEYEIAIKNGFLDMEIKPNEKVTGYIGNISGWLESDAECFSEEYLTKIKEVLQSNGEKEELLWGNAYKALIRKDTTTISYDFEDGNPEMVPCTLPTEMLCEILEIWIKAYEEHREKTKKKEE